MEKGEAMEIVKFAAGLLFLFGIYTAFIAAL